MAIFSQGNNLYTYIGDYSPFACSINNLLPEKDYNVSLLIKMDTVKTHSITVKTNKYGVANCVFPFTKTECEAYIEGSYPYSIIATTDDRKDTVFPSPFEEGKFIVKPKPVS